MKQKAGATPPLLPELAFVVQFREGTDLKGGHIEGRVEHVRSGQATRFSSLEDLLAFMAQILATLPPIVPSRTRKEVRVMED